MFHVLHVKFWGEHRGYEIWHDNKPVVRLRDGVALKKHEAYKLVRLWNYG
jgi:hypothetical protein